MSQDWDLIIVGGGIGGLSCARFLRKTRLRICILERSPGLIEVGAGLQLAPNALAALREIKLADAAMELGWALQKVELRSTRSGLLSTLDASENPLLAIHRAQLQNLLVRNLDPGLMKSDCRLEPNRPSELRSLRR